MHVELTFSNPLLSGIFQMKRCGTSYRLLHSMTLPSHALAPGGTGGANTNEGSVIEVHHHHTPTLSLTFRRSGHTALLMEDVKPQFEVVMCKRHL